MNTNLNEIFKLINPANTIGVNRFLAHALGAAEAVIYSALLAKAAYYDEHGMTSDGWFFSTVADLEESTTFSEKQQRRAIDRLAEAGLIRSERRGMPAKRFFKIADAADKLTELLALGEKIVAERFGAEKTQTRSSAEMSEQAPPKAPRSSAETSEQAPPKARDKFLQNDAVHYKTKDNNQKPKSSNRDDEDLRENYFSALKRNVRYDELYLERPGDRQAIDELLAVMLDVICSEGGQVRVNGVCKPQSEVAQAYLGLKKEHFLSALSAIRSNPNPVLNRRGYIITVLYNSLCSAPASPVYGSAPASSGHSSAPAPVKKSSIDTDRLRAQIMANYRKGFV